eukprot:TRINITY_DN4874_c0_g1_i4.p2 TRINITY_DN4874_c0_g1~~TRINITY_DN4874_c0_g1_i4.p2  ORF type:complete len:106 (+),score=28.58 TRINITY_DN4874_c0_g1_i4:201-518(+)
MKVLILLSAFVLAASALPQTRNELTCDICMDIMTDLDNFITSESTEQEIVDFVKQICSTLGAIIPGFEDTCNLLVGSQLPAIIEGFVNDNMDPTTVCTDLFGACP